MEAYFAELRARIMACTMCNICLEEFDDAELRYDFDAPVCAECAEKTSEPIVEFDDEL
jgi:formylmethanofuran dehydrogenase subunit E